MAKSNVVPVTTKKTELATASDISGFEAFANEGLESVSSQDLAIPYLRILAQLSPQVNKRDGAYVQGAEAGMIYNTVENVVYDGEEGVSVIPCYYRRVYVEWKPREQGGGYVGTYNAEDPIAKKTFKDSKGKDVLPNGNILENTAEFYVLMIDQEGGIKQCLLTMTSTQLKKARKWLTQIQTTMGKGKDGRMFTMPMMSHIYKLSTVEERNDKGSWFGWEVSRDRVLSLASDTDSALFQMAVAFSKSVKAGEIKVKQEVDDHASSDGNGQTIDSDDIPF
jgi:hypothetical protein